MTHNKMIQSDTERHHEERRKLARIEQERLWEDRRDWKLFIH
jgi:hypothetical protein